MISFDRERELELIITNQLSNTYFNQFDNEIIKSDEIGHSHGPGIQKAVCSILKNNCSVSFEVDKKGIKKKRAFSDIVWENLPTNIKFGVSVGSPNLVSMKRMLKKVNENYLDSYYVIFVHYDVSTHQIKTRIVNILQFTDCLEYNGGPGQIMVQQAKFNIEYGNYVSKKRSLKSYNEIKKDINTLYVNRMERHIQTKQRQLDNHKKKYGI